MLQVSRLDITLSEVDLNQLAEEFLDRPEVDEVRLSLGDGLLGLRLVLSKLGINVPVEATARILTASPRQVRLELKVTNLSALPHGIKDLALKKLFDAFDLSGIVYKQGELEIDLDQLLMLSPVYFSLESAAIQPDALRLTVTDLRYLPVVADAATAGALPVPVMQEPPALQVIELPEHQEFYDRLKGKVMEQAHRHLPAKLVPLVPWLMLVPDAFALLVRLLKDRRVPRRAKWIAALAVAYFIDPLDLIPDAIPILGQMDDLAVAFLAVESLLTDTPEAVLRELWPGQGDVIVTVREGVRFFSGYLTGGAVGKLRSLLARRPPAAADSDLTGDPDSRL